MIPFRQGRFADLPERPRRAHPFFDAEVQRVTVDSASLGRHTVPVRRFGQGPPLLLVHGLMTAGYSWRYQLPLLGEHFTLWVPDLVGSGDADKPRGRYGLTEQAEALGALQQALGLHGAPAIGNSLGGTLCLQRLVQQPDAFARLVVLHSPIEALRRLHLLHGVMSLPGSTALLRALVARDPHRWAHAQVHYYDESLKSLEEARVYGDALRTPGAIDAFASMLRDALAPSALRTLQIELLRRPPAVPLQLVYTSHDPVVPPHVGDTLAALLPDAPFVRMHGASHFAHVDAPERFAATVLPFLRG
jgi:pimeloyl-ACP methyl ester carboxylesterase